MLIGATGLLRVRARPYPHLTPSQSLLIINGWAAFIILLFVGCVMYVCVLSTRRSSRKVTANVLHADMVNSDTYAYKKNEHTTRKGLYKRKSNQNIKGLQSKRDILVTTTKNLNAALRARLIERKSEEANLPPSTRDVKHFVESMEDETDMEPCRVRMFWSTPTQIQSIHLFVYQLS